MNSQLKKNLFMIIITILISALLTALVFRLLGYKTYSELKLEELEPRAYYLADITGDFLQGRISMKKYEAAINSDSRVWDAEPYIFGMDHNLIACSASEHHDNNLEIINEYLTNVYERETVSAATNIRGGGILVGLPVIGDRGTVIGAIFLIKSMKDVSAGFGSLIVSLLIALVLSLIIMALPVYIVSKRLSDPIKSMNNAALAMAKGDFTVRAQDSGRDEVAQLGRTLNYLSTALSASVGQLVFEGNKLKSILDGLVEGVIAVGFDGRVIQANPAAINILNCSDKQLEDTEIFKSVWRDIEMVMRMEEQQRVVMRKEKERQLQFTVSPLKTSTDDIVGALILIRDVTEAARLEQTRRDYVANVSHELRTPIASVRSLADVLSDGLVKDEDDRMRYYGYIQKESMRLSRLIDDLLELSRLQSGTVTIEKEEFDVIELLYEIKDRFNNLKDEYGFNIKIDAEDDLPWVYSNSDRCEQVLIALIDNAIKHNNGQNNILLKVFFAGDKINVNVINEGAIAEEDIDHIFERFYKADKSHSGEGTGLGLAISKEIIDLLGEQITVTSQDNKVIFAFTLGILSNEKDVIDSRS